MAAVTASKLRAAALRSRCLSLAKNCSIGLRSGEYFGRKKSLAPIDRIARRTAHPLWLPRLSITTISPGFKVGTRTFDVEAELLAVDRAIEQPWSVDAIVAQRRQERHGLPASVRDFGSEPHAPRPPSPERRHVGLGPGLVDEDQAGRLDPALTGCPLGASPRDVRTILFAGVHGFF